ncbi:MAG: hypothetical protein NTU61_05460 [Candidatus Altiarchaeota archaeon]|nr:hypothetical protein [Candidatus Altiarchaeota archaeon]
MIDPVSGIDGSRMQVLLDYFRKRMTTVQPVEKPHEPLVEYGRRGPVEKLHPDTVGKPPEPKLRFVKFPNFIKYGPEEMARALEDDGLRIQIHPDDFANLPAELQKVMSDFGVRVRAKFVLWEDTGRKVDKLA